MFPDSRVTVFVFIFRRTSVHNLQAFSYSDSIQSEFWIFPFQIVMPHVLFVNSSVSIVISSNVDTHTLRHLDAPGEFSNLNESSLLSLRHATIFMRFSKKFRKRKKSCVIKINFYDLRRKFCGLVWPRGFGLKKILWKCESINWRNAFVGFLFFLWMERK